MNKEAENIQEIIVGEKPYINGLNSEEWKILREEILKRDNYKCQILRTSALELCNLSPQTKILNIHHINENPCYNHSENLITLCQFHHKKIHDLMNYILRKDVIYGKIQILKSIELLISKHCFTESILDILCDYFGIE